MRTDKVQVYRDARGEWRWRYKAANGAILADSGEGYKRRKKAMSQAERVMAKPVGWGAPDDKNDGLVLGIVGVG